MASQNTTLSLVNFSGFDIAETKVSNVLAHDWDYDPSSNRLDPYRPDLNFQGPLANLDARCEREEINSAATEGAKFELSVIIGGETIAWPVDQREAEKKLAGPYTNATIPAARAGLEVYRETGQCEECYTQAFYVRTKKQPDNSDWMKQLLAVNPNVPLNKLTMPGSHDAGMYVDNGKQAAIGGLQSGGGEWALTQHLNFTGQLQAGARYFDLRVYVDNDGVQWAYHGEWHGEFYGTFGGKIDDILGEIADFMNQPGREEAVFVKITPYVGADNYQATIDLVKSRLGALLYVPPGSDASPNIAVDFARTKLRDLAGKVIVAFTEEFSSLLSSSAGTYPYQDCGEEGTGNLLAPRGWLTVYDVYSDTKSFADMKAKQDTRLANYGGLGRDFLFLYSWTLTGSGDLRDLELLSRAANPQLPKRLREMVASGGPRPNIVYIDHVDPWLCSAIIALNQP